MKIRLLVEVEVQNEDFRDWSQEQRETARKEYLEWICGPVEGELQRAVRLALAVSEMARVTVDHQVRDLTVLDAAWPKDAQVHTWLKIGKH